MEENSVPTIDKIPQERLGEHFSSQELETIRNARIGCAGCGAIGSNIAVGLARWGVTNITVADPDIVTDRNLARQSFFRPDIGQNKAKALRSHLIEILSREPNLAVNKSDEDISQIISMESGITEENVEAFVQNSDFIIDAIDIRSQDISFLLHHYAWEYRRPVITAYDIGTISVVDIYRYDLFEPDITPMKGQMDFERAARFSQVKSLYEARAISEQDFMDYVYASLVGPVNPLKVPVDYLKLLLQGRKNPDYVNTLQLPSTALTIGSVASDAILHLILGHNVNDHITVEPKREIIDTRDSMIERLSLIVKVLVALQKRRRAILRKIARIAPQIVK